MPARINIISGVSVGKTFWVEQPVLRIGGRPDVDLCVPSAELAEHVATVEYQDGDYVVYNRSTTSIRVSGTEIAPGRSAVWSRNGELELGDHTVLQLELTGDGSPSVRPVERNLEVDYGLDKEVEAAADEGQAETVAESKASSGSLLKTMGQLAVILFCFSAVGAIVYSEFLGPDEPAGPSGTLLDINSVLVNLSKAAKQASADGNQAQREQLENWLRRLQGAEMSRLRGDTAESRRLYESLRSELLRRQAWLGKSRTSAEEDLLSYVLFRLS